MPKFNLTDLLNQASLNVSESDTPETPPFEPLRIVHISVNDLIPSEDNFYSTDNIAALKTSIEMFGVKQNLAVKPIKNGKYEIISGHRRRLACIELLKEGKRDFEFVPCSVESEHSTIIKKILLIMTNSTTRQLSDWEKTQQAAELRKHFDMLKKQKGLPGRVRDLVAEALRTSPAQVGRMDAIENNLSDDFKEEFKENRLGMSAAYELSGLSENKQKEAFDDYKKKGGLSLNDVKTKKEPAPPVGEREPEKNNERDYWKSRAEALERALRANVCDCETCELNNCGDSTSDFFPCCKWRFDFARFAAGGDYN